MTLSPDLEWRVITSIQYRREDRDEVLVSKRNMISSGKGTREGEEAASG